MSEVSPVEFGRLIGHLEAIRSELSDLKTRTVFRLDDIERRVEKLETSDATQAPYIAIISKAVVWLAIAGAGALIGINILGV